MPYATINGAQLCYEKVGNGPNILVFIHGGNGGMLSSISSGYGEKARKMRMKKDDKKNNLNSDEPAPLISQGGMYGTLIDQIKQPSRTIIAYDRRCAGASQYTIDQYYNIETLALDCLGLMSHLGYKTFAVCGSSMGGPVALLLAIEHPAVVERLIVLNSHACIIGSYPPFNMTAHRAQLFRRIMLMSSIEQRQHFDKHTHAHRMRRQILIDIDAGGASLEPLRSTVEHLTDDELFVYWAGQNHNMFCYVDIDLSDQLAKVICPTLIVHGDTDPIVPYEGAVKMHRSIIGSTLCTVTGGEHGMPAHPECHRAVCTFLNEIEIDTCSTEGTCNNLVLTCSL